MTSSGRWMALIALLLTGFPAAAETPPDVRPNRVRGEYVRPVNPAHQQLYENLQAQNVLERLSEFLAPFRLPQALLMRIRGCNGRVNAYYENAVVTVCYEYLEFFESNVPDKPTPAGLKPEDATLGPIFDLFLHEAGHAMFDLLKIPMMGREEDAADLFSAYILLQLSSEEKRAFILGTATMARKEAVKAMEKSPQFKDFADEHGHPAQRYFNFVCMAYGQDPVLFADAIQLGELPPERASTCGTEYAQFAYAFRSLIQPHMDVAMFSSVRERKWLRPEARAKSAPARE
jgi:hypothetical protein